MSVTDRLKQPFEFDKQQCQPVRFVESRPPKGQDFPLCLRGVVPLNA